MIKIGQMYLFITMGYYYSGIATEWNPGHVTIRDARVHKGELGVLGKFDRDGGDTESLPDGVIVPLSGTVIIPL